MTPAEAAAALIIAVGSAGIIPQAVKGFQGWRSGRAREEKAENRDLLTRTVTAEASRDAEADFRRRIEEWAGGLVYMLKQIGVPADKIPAKPERNQRVSP